MSDNLSTRFPTPPELQPLGKPSVKGRQVFSLVLIAAGFLLLAMGSWMFIQFQIEAHKPPPARIIEVSLADLTPTPTSTPRPSPTKVVLVTPSPTPVHHLGDLLIITPTRTPRATATPIANTPTPQPTATPTSTSTPMPPPHTPTPTSTSTSGPTYTPVPENTPTPEATVMPSMQENLLVEESADAGITPAATAANDAPPVSPITRIVAESIGLDTPVIAVGWTTQIINEVPVNVWTVADYVAGWHKNSALPGQGGNIVFSGHHNIKGEIFRHTIDLNVGDIITLYMGDQSYKYAVVDKFIVKDKGEPDAVRRANAKWIGPFNEERLTLVTCWPYTNNTHRAIVIAKPVQP